MILRELKAMDKVSDGEVSHSSQSRVKDLTGRHSSNDNDEKNKWHSQS